MAATVSTTLADHTKARARRPHLQVTAANSRADAFITRWERWYSGSESDSPIAATLTPDGTLVRARNDAGTCYVSRVTTPTSGSTFSSWTSVQTGLVSGSAVALASKSAEILLIYCRGTTLYARSSTDDGATWSSETTIVNEGTAVSALAVSFRNLANGNACLFYANGATVKRLRRNAGTWAASGTSWTNTVAGVTGIAVAYSGDFALLVSGTEVTTTHKRVWALLMGDGNLPSNVWGGLVNVAEADSASTTTFRGPTVAYLKSQYRGAFVHRESGDVAYDRAFETHPPAADVFTSTWSEPAPHDADNSYGFALAYDGTGDDVFAVTPDGVWHATIDQTLDLSSEVIRARVRLGAFHARCELTLDNADYELPPEADLAADSALFVGGQITVTAGYRSGADAAIESGAVWRFTVDAITHAIDAQRRRTLTVHASGPWEQVARWHAPQAWQVASGVLNRWQVFSRIAARSGFPAYLGSGDQAPSADWSGYSPSFVLAQGEAGDTALKRMLATVNDAARADYDFTIQAIETGQASSHDYGPGDVPIVALSLREEPPSSNWVRLHGGTVGATRYADAYDAASVYQHGPRRRWLRSIDASTDARAEAFSANALRRDRWAQEKGELTAPHNPALQLFDIITVTEPDLDLSGVEYRVLAMTLDYDRSGNNPRYQNTITLGAHE